MQLTEQNCTITHQGRAITAQGATVTPERLIAYVGRCRFDGMGCDRLYGTSYDLTDWHGNVIGSIRLTTSWRAGWVTIHQAYATVAGVEYVGRTQGPGMYFSGRARRTGKRYAGLVRL